MKKLIASLAAAVAVIALCLCLAACSTGFVGTYKFSKMSMTQGGMSINIEVGKDYMGVTISEDFYILEVKDDNTFVMTVNMGEEVTENGTWEEKDGKYYLTADGETIEVTLSGNTVIFENEGAKVELKK